MSYHNLEAGSEKMRTNSVDSNEDTLSMYDSDTLLMHDSDRLRFRTNTGWRSTAGWVLASSIISALISGGATWIVSSNHQAHSTWTNGRIPGDMPLDSTSAILQIDRNYTTTYFSPWNWNGSEWNEHPRFGRVDDLWDGLIGQKNGFFLIPPNEGAQHGLDKRTHAFLRGVEGEHDGFPVSTEASHQMHCLDTLRRKLFMNREWYVENWKHMAPPELDMPHVAHCLNMLRELIMCHADVGVLPWVWIDGPGRIYPDFHRPHQCRNYTAVREFQEGRAMPQSIDGYTENLAPPPDAQFADMKNFQ